MLIQAPDKGSDLKWRLDKIPDREELIQKRRTVFWFNAETPCLWNDLSRAPHCLERNLIPVSIEQARLVLAAELDHAILPYPVDRKAARLKGKLRGNTARPVCQRGQERMIFHDDLSPQTSCIGRADGITRRSLMFKISGMQQRS